MPLLNSRILLIFAASLLGVFQVEAQVKTAAAEPDFLKRTVTVGVNSYDYRVYVPKNRQPKKKMPVMLFLHGNGANGTDNERQIFGIGDFIKQNPERFSFIMVFPQSRQGKFWVGEMLEQAEKALDQSVTEFNGDTRRIYLAGYSMGGYGAWQLAALKPAKFAALVPVAGGIVPPPPFLLTESARKDVSPTILQLLAAPNPYEAFAAKIGKTPTWIFHGNLDKSVPVTESRQIFEALKKQNSKTVAYTELPDIGHNSIENAFAEPKLYEWLAKQKLKK